MSEGISSGSIERSIIMAKDEKHPELSLAQVEQPPLLDE
jgi:hypothetical protein